MENWKRYCEIIIETNGNPSVKDAEECGISFAKWFEMTTRVTRVRLVQNAEEVLRRYKYEI